MTKPWLRIDKQIELLKSRGMTDADLYQQELRTIGYYRLSGYWYPFRKQSLEKKKRLDDFVDGTLMRQVLELYTFDETLRHVLLELLGKLEVALRTDLAYILGEVDPFAHQNLIAKQESPKHQKRFEEFSQKLHKNVEKSSEDFIKHHKNNYHGEIPIWVITEVLEFGQVVNLYALSPFEIRKKIAADYKVRADEFESWMRTANYLRNICAHHARLWNRQLTIRPVLTHRKTDKLFLTDESSRYKLFGALQCLMYLAYQKGYHHEVKDLYQQLLKLPLNHPVITYRSMGVPDNWNEYILQNANPSYKTHIQNLLQPRAGFVPKKAVYS